MYAASTRHTYSGRKALIELAPPMSEASSPLLRALTSGTKTGWRSTFLFLVSARHRAARSHPPRILAPGRSPSYAADMVTQPVDTTKAYMLSAGSACLVTLTLNGKSATWQAIANQGGQCTLLVPAGGILAISNEDAVLAPLPFKAAPAAVGIVSGGAYDNREAAGATAQRRVIANAILSQLSWADLLASCKTSWMHNLILDCVTGEEAYINLSNLTAPNNQEATKYDTTLPLIAFNKNRYELGSGVKGLRALTIQANTFWRGGAARFSYNNDEVDFTLIANHCGDCFMFSHIDSGYYTHMKSLTVICPTETGTNASNIGLVTNYSTGFNREWMRAPKRIIAPSATNGAAFTYSTVHSPIGWVQNEDQADLNITAYLPSYVSSLDFYISCPNTVSNLIYLMDNLGTPATGNIPQLKFGVDASLVNTNGETPFYTDPELQAAVERLQQKGWEAVPSPVTIS